MQIGPKIRFDSHTLGNLVKNVSPALAFTPVGLAGTAVAAGLGEVGRGKSGLGDIARSVGSNVVIGAGARGVANHFGGGAPASPAPVADSGPIVSDAGEASGNWSPIAATPDPIAAAPVQQGGPGFLSKISSGAGKAFDWAQDHDKTSAAVLGGLGDAFDPTERRLRSAQAASLERQNEEGTYEYQQKKARDAALEPLRQALYGRLGTIGGA